ncbi:hypothetical protein WUBG_11935 [Wuchereria bancrofti]|uniref:Uncharacterized protein n=1 Tax=Wuchereria bancrofti TaxID=6293 RepID=J9E4U4_WUCBA|nr:hypothetical protein WUBG_11935 [Wuchereria bancrofti]
MTLMQAPHYDQSVKLRNGVCSFCRAFQCFWKGNDDKEICAYISVQRSTFDSIILPWPKYVNIADPGSSSLLSQHHIQLQLSVESIAESRTRVRTRWAVGLKCRRSMIVIATYKVREPPTPNQ